MQCDPFSADIGSSPPSNHDVMQQLNNHIMVDLDLSSFDPPDVGEFNTLVMTPQPGYPDNQQYNDINLHNRGDA